MGSEPLGTDEATNTRSSLGKVLTHMTMSLDGSRNPDAELDRGHVLFDDPVVVKGVAPCTCGTGSAVTARG